MEKTGAPGHDDDGVIGDGGDGGNEEDHGVTQKAEAGAEAKGLGAAAAIAHGGGRNSPPAKIKEFQSRSWGCLAAGGKQTLPDLAGQFIGLKMASQSRRWISLQ